MVSEFVENRLLKYTAWVFAAALLLHNMDHLRRGLKVLTPEVLWAGMALNIAAVAAIALVVARRNWAPAAATGVGFFMAIGVTASHLLPHWSVFSDAFPERHCDQRSRDRPRWGPRTTNQNWCLVSTLIRCAAEMSTETDSCSECHPQH